jgi:hypothetical protein
MTVKTAMRGVWAKAIGWSHEEQWVNPWQASWLLPPPLWGRAGWGVVR